MSWIGQHSAIVIDNANPHFVGRALDPEHMHHVLQAADYHSTAVNMHTFKVL